jgi:hypothetical protein
MTWYSAFANKEWRIKISPEAFKVEQYDYNSFQYATPVSSSDDRRRITEGLQARLRTVDREKANIGVWR